jgi:hypothetical protein
MKVMEGRTLALNKKKTSNKKQYIANNRRKTIGQWAHLCNNGPYSNKQPGKYLFIPHLGKCLNNTKPN